MQRTLLFAVIAAGAALTIPQLVERSLETAGQQQTQPAVKTTAPVKQRERASYSGGRGVVLNADARGHFQGTFRINGRNVEGLIDTGASVIAINRSTARKLGLTISAQDYTYRVSTANGVVEAAHVVLKRVEIQSIRINKVDAFVLDDNSLAGTLIGMSFLNKLKSYQVKNGEMVLRAK